MKDWSVVEQLANIRAPILVMNGAADGATDSAVEPFTTRIPDAKWVKFEVSWSPEPAIAKLADSNNALKELEPHGPLRRAGEIYENGRRVLVRCLDAET